MSSVDINLNGKNVSLDSDGYLLDPGQWNHEVAVEIAKKEGIGLNDDYWKIFDVMRNYYDRYKTFPSVSYITNKVKLLFGLNKKQAKVKIFKMFPYGYIAQACKISGMKHPKGWNTN